MNAGRALTALQAMSALMVTIAGTSASGMTSEMTCGVDTAMPSCVAPHTQIINQRQAQRRAHSVVVLCAVKRVTTDKSSPAAIAATANHDAGVLSTQMVATASTHTSSALRQRWVIGDVRGNTTLSTTSSAMHQPASGSATTSTGQSDDQ